MPGSRKRRAASRRAGVCQTHPGNRSSRTAPVGSETLRMARCNRTRPTSRPCTPTAPRAPSAGPPRRVRGSAVSHRHTVAAGYTRSGNWDSARAAGRPSRRSGRSCAPSRAAATARRHRCVNGRSETRARPPGPVRSRRPARPVVAAPLPRRARTPHPARSGQSTAVRLPAPMPAIAAAARPRRGCPPPRRTRYRSRPTSRPGRPV